MRNEDSGSSLRQTELEQHVWNELMELRQDINEFCDVKTPAYTIPNATHDESVAVYQVRQMMARLLAK